MSSTGSSACPREQKLEALSLTGDQGTCFNVSPVLGDTLACSADDVVDDLSGDWLRADQADRSALVQ